MNVAKRTLVSGFLCLAAAVGFAACGLEYQAEEFTLKIGNGGVKLAVLYQNFGSSKQENHLRQKDLTMLQEAASDDSTVRDARKKGVALKNRRLDYVDYTLNGYVEAEAESIGDIFEVFTNYTLEVDDRIYIIPRNGTVARAVLSGDGKIVIRKDENGKDRYAFAWPLDARDISFDASYKVRGASFKYEFLKKFKGN